MTLLALLTELCSHFSFLRFALNHGWDHALTVKTSASTIIPGKETPAESSTLPSSDDRDKE